MTDWIDRLAGHWTRLEQKIQALPIQAPSYRALLGRWLGDAAALRFHLRQTSGPALWALLGGTGTGKSTLLNRLFGLEISATSFRRTFTAGPIAVAARGEHLPPDWLNLDMEIITLDACPARGEAGKLLLVLHDHPLTEGHALVDTPDLDGDQPPHHLLADRVFRWIHGAIFVVTPEKYQMTELWPYYGLARRYRIPAVFVMNKCEELAELADYTAALAREGWGHAPVLACPRDGSVFAPPPEARLDRLEHILIEQRPPEGARRETGLAMRAADLLERLRDQLLEPLVEERRAIERLRGALRAMFAPQPGINVSPLTRALQRRMQAQSIFHLMGPARVLRRAGQVPELLARLPRAMWDVMRGEAVHWEAPPPQDPPASKLPDFRAIAMDQWAGLQARIDDLLQSASPAVRSAASTVQSSEPSLQSAPRRIPAEDAGRLVDDELAELRRWLEARWNARPRDTRVLEKLLRHVPGAKKLIGLSETAPYLLTLVLAVSDTVFGPVDLVVLGGYSLATWVGERLSDEVTQRTRQANQRIDQRFDALAGEQLRLIDGWLDRLAPRRDELDEITRAAEAAMSFIEEHRRRVE